MSNAIFNFQTAKTTVSFQNFSFKHNKSKKESTLLFKFVVGSIIIQKDFVNISIINFLLTNDEFFGIFLRLINLYFN